MSFLVGVIGGFVANFLWHHRLRILALAGHGFLWLGAASEAAGTWLLKKGGASVVRYCYATTALSPA